MSDYVIISFGRMYQFYSKWGDADAFYHTAFVHGVLVASTVNFLIAIVFNLTGCSFFRFGLYPVGIFLIIIIGMVTFYLHTQRATLLDSSLKLPRQRSRKDWHVLAFKIVMFSTWILAPVFYKIGVS